METAVARDYRRDLVADGLLSVPDAEAFSGLKKSTLYLLMADGSLPYCKVGAARRIPRRALVEFLARNLVIRGGDQN